VHPEPNSNTPSSPLGREPSAVGFRRVWRPATYGALVVLAAGPVFGILRYVYLWFLSGNTFHLLEALALFAAASIMGAAAGAAYGYLAPWSNQSWGRRFVVYATAMEAYLLLGTAIILTVHFLVPALMSDIPATSPLFHAGLHAYGLALVSIGVGFAYCMTRFRRTQ